MKINRKLMRERESLNAAESSSTKVGVFPVESLNINCRDNELKTTNS